MTRVMIACVFCIFQFWSVRAFADDGDVAVATISPVVTRFLKTNCVRCHGPEEQNADVRLDTMPDTVSDGTIALRWQDVLDVLNLGQMPPEDEPRPPKDDETRAIEALTANLQEARKRLTDTGGHIVIRRLNRRQYVRTIDALFGMPVDTTRLPQDAVVDGFDTLRLAQSFSSLTLETYLELGRGVLDKAYDFRALNRAKPYEFVEQAETRISREIREEIPRLEQKAEGFKESIAAGRKDRIVARDIKLMEADLSRDYLSRKETQSGALVPFKGLSPFAWSSINGGVRPGTYRVRVRCGIAADKAVDNFFMKVVRGQFRSKSPDSIDYFHITGTTTEPQIVEFTVDIDHLRSNRLQFSRRDVRPQRLDRYTDVPDYFFKYQEIAWLEDDDRPDLWIDKIEFDGPLPRTEPTLSAKSLFDGEEPKELDEPEARKLIERFAFEAFRHVPPDPGYVDRLTRIYATSRSRGAEPSDALKDAFAVVLASPQFLFLEEPTAHDGSPRPPTTKAAALESHLTAARPLTDRELALRLSYFLWSAPPDKELYRLVEEGSLHEPHVLAGQVDRLLDSPRSNVFIETFASQWLELERLNSIDPEATSAEIYDAAVQRHSLREVFETFRVLLDQDRPVTDLLDSRYVVVNAVLADFYGLNGVAGDEFRVVELPADSPRGGLLGQSAILTLTGTGVRTSPVERGAYILRKLLHRPPPPAPANVPMLDEETVGQRSIRDTLTMHQSAPQCASCHRRIDPLGFALENFDPVGKWRTSIEGIVPPRHDPEQEEPEGGKMPPIRIEFPIETAGLMPDGQRRFSGPIELKRRIFEDRESFLRALTESLMTYGLGRSITFSDQPRVDSIVAATIEQDYRLRALIQEIVRSEAFTMRLP